MTQYISYQHEKLDTETDVANTPSKSGLGNSYEIRTERGFSREHAEERTPRVFPGRSSPCTESSTYLNHEYLGKEVEGLLKLLTSPSAYLRQDRYHPFQQVWKIGERKIAYLDAIISRSIPWPYIGVRNERSDTDKITETTDTITLTERTFTRERTVCTTGTKFTGSNERVSVLATAIGTLLLINRTSGIPAEQDDRYRKAHP